MCKPIEKAIATSSHGLAHGGICRSDESSESALSALSISMTTRTESCEQTFGGGGWRGGAERG